MHGHGASPTPGEAAAEVAGEDLFVDLGPRSGPPDSLVLDIGGDVGALVLYTGPGALGAEIEVSLAGDTKRTHTMVRRRRIADGEIIAGVYPDLLAGTYVLWGLDGEPAGTVEVTGGAVTEHTMDLAVSRR